MSSPRDELSSMEPGKGIACSDWTVWPPASWDSPLLPRPSRQRVCVCARTHLLAFGVLSGRPARGWGAHLGAHVQSSVLALVATAYICWQPLDRIQQETQEMPEMAPLGTADSWFGKTN